jgi:hypothetical protein
MRRRTHVFGVIVVLTSLPLLAHCGDASFQSDAPDAALDGTSATDSSIPDTWLPDAIVATGDAAVGASPCAGAASHWICDDFDRDGGIADFPYWTATNVTDAATLAMQPPGGPAAPSPPNALVTAVAADSEAVVFKSALTSASGLSCEFDVRIDQDGDDYLSNIALISLYSASTYYRLNATLSPAASGDSFADYAGLADGGAIVSSPETFAMPRRQWTHVRMQASIGSTGGEVAIFVNGVDRNFTTSIDLATLGTPTSMSFQLGSATGNGSGGSWQIAFDNAYCDLIL